MNSFILIQFNFTFVLLHLKYHTTDNRHQSLPHYGVKLYVIIVTKTSHGVKLHGISHPEPCILSSLYAYNNDN